MFICLDCLAFLVDNVEGNTSDGQVDDINSLESVKIPPVSPDLSSIKISIFLSGGLPVQLFPSGEPLLANEQNVVQSLQVYYEDHDGFDREHCQSFIQSVDQYLVHKEGYIADEDQTDYLVAHQIDMVPPYYQI